MVSPQVFTNEFAHVLDQNHAIRKRSGQSVHHETVSLLGFTPARIGLRFESCEVNP